MLTQPYDALVALCSACFFEQLPARKQLFCWLPVQCQVEPIRQALPQALPSSVRHRTMQSLPLGNLQSKYTGIRQAFATIVREEGVRVGHFPCNSSRWQLQSSAHCEGKHVVMARLWRLCF